MGFVYAIADDVIMRDIASGAFTGTPDGHLIFVQYALGWLISRLYLINRSVDWYGFFMAGALFLSLAAILYRGLAAEKSLRWKCVYSIGATGVTLTALVAHAAQFEWTISAAALGAAGPVPLCVGWTRENDCGRRRLDLAAADPDLRDPFGCIFYGIARLRPGLPLEDLPEKRECKKMGI